MRISLFKLLAILPVLAALTAMPAYAAKPPVHEGNSKLSMNKDAYYITMNPMVLPVINEHGLREVVSMVVALEVKKEEDKDTVSDLVPRLNDAYMRALYGKINSTSYRNGEFLDVNKLKTRLTNVTDNIVGKGKVQEVLIQGVNQRAYN